MDDFFTLLPDVKVVGGFLVLHSTEYSAVADEQHKVDEPEHDEPDCHPHEEPKAECLVEDWEEWGSQEHGDPADDVHGGEDELVLINALKVSNVHWR